MELLVVITIISLLVSILLPSLNKAKELARRVVCSSNMRNLGLAFSMYQNEWDGWFPLVREQGPNPLTGVWADTLYNGYSRDVNAFCCPSVPDRTFTPNETNGAWPMAYGMEWWLGGAGHNEIPATVPVHRITDVEQPNKTVLLGENGSYSHGYGVHNWGWPDPDVAGWGWPDDNRHGGMSNILFVDGHIDPYVAEEALDTNGDLIWYRPEM